MWELDLENLVMSQTDTMDTQADADIPQFIAFSWSRNIVATRLEQSHIDFLDMTTEEVVLHMDIDKQDYEDNMEIAFSPNEDQIVFLSESFITIYDIVHPNNHVSFNPWPGKHVQFWQVTFQTCNNLVICTLDNKSTLM